MEYLTTLEGTRQHNEASTMLSLNHPNIVRVTDFGIIDDRTPYIVMIYAPNGTLRGRHPHGTLLTLPTILSYVLPIANALQYAYNQKKLIHRDIKPENILIGPNQEVLISDFGIATIARHTSTQNAQEVAGTSIYMAPEQFRGKPRPASDQYSLGIMVYEWLTGQPPFTEGNYIQLGYQHVHEPPPPLRTALPSITPAVEQVVLKALEKDPAARFADIQMFAQALETAYKSGQFSSRSSHTHSTSSYTSSPASSRSASPPPSAQPAQAPQAPPPPWASTRYTSHSGASPSHSASQSPYSTPPAYQPQPHYRSIPQQSYPTPPLYQPQPSFMPTATNQPKPNNLPLIHGRAITRDMLVMGGFVVSLFLLTIPLFLSKSTMTSPTSAYFISVLIWFLIVLPLSVLGGAIFGKWRGALASLLYFCITYVIGAAANPTVFTTDASALGFLSLPIATFIIGFMYERRSTRGCLGSIGIILLGSEIFAIGVASATLAVHPPSSLAGGLGAVAILALIVAPIFAFFASIFERIIQVVVGVGKRKAKRAS